MVTIIESAGIMGAVLSRCGSLPSRRLHLSGPVPFGREVHFEGRFQGAGEGRPVLLLGVVVLDEVVHRGPDFGIDERLDGSPGTGRLLGFLRLLLRHAEHRRTPAVVARHGSSFTLPVFSPHVKSRTDRITG